MKNKNEKNKNRYSENSQVERIYRYYLKGGKLTTLKALKLFNTMNLRSRNSDIEKRYNLKLGREWIKDKNTGKRYLKYFMIFS